MFFLKKHCLFLGSLYPSILKYNIPYYYLCLNFNEILNIKKNNIYFYINNILNKKITCLGTPFEPYDKSFSLKENQIKNFIFFSNKKNFLFLPNSNINIFHNIKNKYFTYKSFSDMELRINYLSFNHYLDNIKQKTKSSAKKNIKTFKKLKYKIFLLSKKNYIKEIYQSYSCIRKKSNIQWILHKKNYFGQTLYIKNCKIIIALNIFNDFLGFILFFRIKNTIHVGNIGIKKKHQKKGSIYFRLFYSIIEYAILKKINYIRLEPTEYQFKKKLGAKFEKLKNIIILKNSSRKIL